MDSAGNRYSAVDVANAYFRAGADKISIGMAICRALEAGDAAL
jgi:imidazole glycerol phosphate synthase subunit HisF